MGLRGSLHVFVDVGCLRMDPGVFFGKRPFCRLSEALEAAGDVAVHAEEPVDIIVPPEPSVETVEEEGDDDGTTDTVVNDVSGKLELHCGGCEETRDDARPRNKKAKVQRPSWKNSQPEYHWATPTRGTEERELNLKSLYFGKSPNEVFSTILDDEILTHIIVQTGKYAKQNNEHGFVINIEDVKKFIGILLLSGYHKLPSQRMYWSLDEDAGVSCVASCMSRQRFLDIKRFLHLADYDLIQSTSDRMFKMNQ
ncbi:hypothetical protein V5799_021375 [Amblyomma americanum]|uniref:PiggyBac transposable element-derived protein domain-containing protein n=1 Tax=Amblyomma americanum TaxID=6943 RepID=A0AAQ4FNI4_AMBAM